MTDVFQVNGEAVTLPHRPVLGLTVTQQSRLTTLLVTDFGLKVRFNGVAALVVKLPESFAGTSRALARRLRPQQQQLA